jgi:hypothetical protein
MSSFKRRVEGNKHKRRNGRRDKSEFETRHIENKVRKLMTKDKSEKYRRYDAEDF